MAHATSYHIGLLIYPQMTQLDITAPQQVFSLLPSTQVDLLWKTKEPVTSADGLTILPTLTWQDCPSLDVLCVPGGPGQSKMMANAEVLTFLKAQGKTAQYITSVCTGSLILAAAGLLKGYRASSHWAFLDQLAYLGVEAVNERVVVDRNRITGGGVTAGIDFGLVVASHLCGQEIAQQIQLLLQYDPAPPFDVGSPEKASKELVEQVYRMGKEIIEASWQQTRQTANQSRMH